MEASVSEIHCHPLRPSGFAEPLFLGREAKKEIAEHFRESACWLKSAGGTRSVELAERACHVYRGAGGEAWLVRPGGRRLRSRANKRRVRRVISSWREVRGWWEAGGGVDRLLFRVLLEGGGVGGGLEAGAVVDLALERGYGWSLVRVLD